MIGTAARAILVPIVLATTSTYFVAEVGGQENHHKAINAYVEFVAEQTQGPVEYLLGLFQTHDMVVLCERAHPEVTQYDLIMALLREKQFRERIGHVFIETGTSSMRSRL